MNSRKRAASRKSKQSSRISRNDYQVLEDRKLLAVDVGASITSIPLLPDQPITADIHGDIGPNHIVQFTNDQYTVRTVGGAELVSLDLEAFFGQLAAADIVIGQDDLNIDIIGDIQDARIVFDHDSERWFASAVVADENGESLFGNDVLLAVSRTSDPIDGFQSVQFIGDTTETQFSNFATLAVNGDGVIITTINEQDPLNTTVSVFAIPKQDLIGETPSAINLSRFENLNQTNYGNTIHFATNQTTDSGSTYGVATFDGGTEISVLEITNLGTGDPVDLLQSNVTVPLYSEAPDARQPNDVARLNNISPSITGNAVSQDGYLWTTHTVEGSAGNSAIRWYQIDEASGTVINSGDIEDVALDFIYPSIAVNEFGGIAIAYTGSGVNDSESASVYASLGFLNNGLDDVPTITFPQEPTVIQAGTGNFVNIQDGINPFGEYSSVGVDPDDPFSFFSFQQFVAAEDVFGGSINELGISGIRPVINGDAAGNEIVVRRNLDNNERIEFVIDGVVTDTYEFSAVDSYQLNLGDGDDTVIIDNSQGDIFTTAGFDIVGGLGNDTLQVIDATGHVFEITGDGTGLFDSISTFTELETLVGGDGDDLFSAVDSASDWTIRGGEGNDRYDIRSSAVGNYILEGEAGDDIYGVPLSNFSMITIVDSAGENDSLLGLGTPDADTLTISQDMDVPDGEEPVDVITFNGETIEGFVFDGLENLDFDGVEGDDTFNIQVLTRGANFFGSEGSDTFNISSSAPGDLGTTGLIVGQLGIDGGEGPNRLFIGHRLGFAVDATISADQITGYTPEAITYAGDFAGFDGQAGIEIQGSDLGSDSFEIRDILAGNTLLVTGGLGDETFTIRNTTAGDVTVDGELGADAYRTSLGQFNRNVDVLDSGEDDSLDRLSIRATDLADTLSIQNNRLNASGEIFDWAGVENVILDSRDGNDVINVGTNVGNSVRVILNAGDDIGTVNGTGGLSAVRFDGLDGDDTFQFNSSVASTFVQARGGEGNDVFELAAESFGRSRVDGENGDDNVTVAYASRDARRVNVRDSGDGGMDSLTIVGTPTADRVDLRPRIVDRAGEFVAYDENTESLSIDLLGSNDILNLFGSSATFAESNLGIGNDTLNVISTSSPKDNPEYVFSLAAGSDVANVYRISENARVEVFGQVGDDSFNVGATLNDNNGNLNLIRGELFLGGGADTDGFDVLQVNDLGSGVSPFQYSITDRSISHIPGPFGLSRPFSSFGFNDMEFVFLSTNNATNSVFVQPSTEAIIRVDGNGQIDQLFVALPPGTEITDSPGNADNGFFSFDNGFKNVSFQEIESSSVDEPDGFALSLGDDGNVDDFLTELLLDATIDLGI